MLRCVAWKHLHNKINNYHHHNGLKPMCVEKNPYTVCLGLIWVKALHSQAICQLQTTASLKLSTFVDSLRLPIKLAIFLIELNPLFLAMSSKSGSLLYRQAWVRLTEWLFTTPDCALSPSMEVTFLVQFISVCLADCLSAELQKKKKKRKPIAQIFMKLGGWVKHYKQTKIPYMDEGVTQNQWTGAKTIFHFC